MDIKEVRSCIDLVREASKADLTILSLFLLPVLLGAWSVFLNTLHFLDHHDGYRIILIGLLLAIYVVGLMIMRCWDPREEKLKRARYHVQHRLEQRPGHRASFDAIKDEVSETYTDEFIRELIDKSPGTFRTCMINRTDGSRPGITLVDEDVAPEAPPNTALDRSGGSSSLK